MVAHNRKFQNYETVTDGCIPSKNKFKNTKKNTQLRWLASDANFKLLHIRCPIAHTPACLGHFEKLGPFFKRNIMGPGGGGT